MVTVALNARAGRACSTKNCVWEPAAAGERRPSGDGERDKALYQLARDSHDRHRTQERVLGQVQRWIAAGLEVAPPERTGTR
jgi:hypothetical protein